MFRFDAGQKHAVPQNCIDACGQGLTGIIWCCGQRSLAKDGLRIHADRRSDSENALRGLVRLPDEPVGTEKQNTAREIRQNGSADVLRTPGPSMFLLPKNRPLMRLLFLFLDDRVVSMTGLMIEAGCSVSG